MSYVFKSGNMKEKEVDSKIVKSSYSVLKILFICCFFFLNLMILKVFCKD